MRFFFLNFFFCYCTVKIFLFSSQRQKTFPEMYTNVYNNIIYYDRRKLNNNNYNNIPTRT